LFAGGKGHQKFREGDQLSAFIFGLGDQRSGDGKIFFLLG
jgi:hypothetical protein